VFRISKNGNPRGQYENKIALAFLEGKRYPDKRSVAVNPRGVMPTCRNDPSFSNMSLMACEGEKSVISIVDHNQSYERPGNVLTKN